MFLKILSVLFLSLCVYFNGVNLNLYKALALPIAHEISEAGIEHIKKEEGFVPCIYPDVIGVSTIAWGHKVLPKDNIKTGCISIKRAEELLENDVNIVNNCINKYITTPLRQVEFDAIGDLLFNIGCPRFRRSNQIKKLNAGDIDASSLEFLSWRMAGGRVFKALENRRKRTRHIFEGGTCAPY